MNQNNYFDVMSKPFADFANDLSFSLQTLLSNMLATGINKAGMTARITVTTSEQQSEGDKVIIPDLKYKITSSVNIKSVTGGTIISDIKLQLPNGKDGDLFVLTVPAS